MLKKRNLELLEEIGHLRAELEETRQSSAFLSHGEDPRAYVSTRPETHNVVVIDPEEADGGLVIRHSLGRQAANFARYLDGIPIIPYGPQSQPRPAQTQTPTSQGCVFTQ